MRKDPLSPKYIKAEVRIDPITKEVIRIEVTGQIAETEDNIEIIGLHKAIETIIFEEIPEDTEDRKVEENIGMIGAMNTVEVGTGQGKGHLQEVIIIET